MQRKYDFAPELTERLIDESSEHTIDIEPAAPAPQFKAKTIPLMFPNRQLQAYFFAFLDFETLGNYAFINQATMQNVLFYSSSPQVGDSRTQFLKGLRDIAFFEDDTALVDDCKVSMEDETVDTCLSKLGRHLTWTVPYIGGTIATVGSFIAQCVERSGVKDRFGEAKELLHTTLTKTCEAFFGHYEWDAKGDYYDRSSWHWKDTYFCVSDSYGWEDCRQMKVMTDACRQCIQLCGELNDLDSNYNSTWWQAAGWGIGTIAAVAVIGVGGGFLVGGCSDRIGNLFNALNKPFKRLSPDTKKQIYTLKIEFKEADLAKTIIEKLDKKKAELNRPDRNALVRDKLFFAFVLFRETLPHKKKEPKQAGDWVSVDKPKKR